MSRAADLLERVFNQYNNTQFVPSGSIQTANIAPSAGNSFGSFVPQNAAVAAVNSYVGTSSHLNGLADRYEANDSGEYLMI